MLTEEYTQRVRRMQEDIDALHTGLFIPLHFSVSTSSISLSLCLYTSISMSPSLYLSISLSFSVSLCSLCGMCMCFPSGLLFSVSL